MSGSIEGLYLGHELDAETAQPTGARLALASDRLTTHGIIVGMTGSGKTGLGIVLLEEVLASGVPAIVLDPKGDMGNLLLNFPSLRPGDFEPWVDEGEARRSGVTTAELAAEQAARWREGLAGAGIDGERMTRLREGVDMRILTPGSTAGTPLDLVGDLSPPEGSWEEEGETIRDEIEGLVSGLLVMVGVEADPLTSREHILLSNLVEHGWREGRALDLPTLILQIQSPPLRRLGVFELDAFYPEKDRMKLAMRLNGLMASPSFAEWMTGDPLDVGRLLYAPDGRPRASIVYLSHLSESERLFVVTLLLTKLITWMRRLPGTSELKALLYADEVVGFAPPTAEPPTKKPLLTLYKQARAHGVGLVLATQNPIDLDYKLMSNAGTWMVGRLQTERDKARIVEGLRSAGGEVDVPAWDARIGQLGKRQFLLKSAGSPRPELFSTRWAMSYLRGPLTRAELLRLGPDAAAADRGATPRSPGLADDESPVPPPVASAIDVRYLDPAAEWRSTVGAGQGARRLRPGLAVRVRLLFDERVGAVRHEEEWEAVVFPLDGAVDPAAAVGVDHDPRDFLDQPPDGATYVLGDAAIGEPAFFRSAEQAIEDSLTRERTLRLLKNDALKVHGRPGESEAAFRERCVAAAEDRADAEAEKLRDRYEAKLATARRRLADAERRVDQLDVDVGQRRQQELVSGAGEVLSMFLGGRRRVRSLSGMSSRRSRTVRAEARLRGAVEKAEDQQQIIEGLEQELAEELDEIWQRWKDVAGDVSDFEIGLERSDVELDRMTLFWAPVGSG